jgi:hypothetical protein
LARDNYVAAKLTCVTHQQLYAMVLGSRNRRRSPEDTCNDDQPPLRERIRELWGAFSPYLYRPGNDPATTRQRPGNGTACG